MICGLYVCGNIKWSVFIPENNSEVFYSLLKLSIRFRYLFVIKSFEASKSAIDNVNLY